MLQDVAGTQLCDRYFVGRCAGPCADRIRPTDYELHLGACDALLTGDEVRSIPLKKGMLVAIELHGSASLVGELRFSLTQKAAAELE